MIEKALRQRPATERDLLQVVNEEITPVVTALRADMNKLQTPAPAAEEEDAIAAVTVDWRVKRHALIVLAAPLTEVVFRDPVDAGYYYLQIQQSGGGNTIGLWPSTVRWPGASAPTVTATAGRIDLGEFYWDGTQYLGRLIQDYG